VQKIYLVLTVPAGAKELTISAPDPKESGKQMTIQVNLDK